MKKEVTLTLAMDENDETEFFSFVMLKKYVLLLIFFLVMFYET